eukprot:CCRYP_002384-RA/>CCRYP_002384-RA protein AED:0.17 eAED:0.17 QI:1345/0.5/0.66/1/0/0/3/0/142
MDLIYTRRFQGGLVDVEEHRLRNNGVFLRMFLMLLARQTEHSPHLSFPASLRKHISQWTRDITRRVKHFVTVVHYAHGGVFREDNEVHSGKAEFGSFDDGADLTCIGNDFFGGVETRHGVLEHTDSFDVVDMYEVFEIVCRH